MKKTIGMLFLILTFVLINVDVWKGRSSSNIFRDPDEAWYGIVLKYVQSNGCESIPVTYHFQDRPNFHSCQFLKYMGVLLPSENIFTQVAVIKVVSRIFILSAIILFFHWVVGSWWLGTLVGLSLMLDGGLFVFKPAVSSLHKIFTGHLDDFTRLNRLISPQQYHVPLLFWILNLSVWCFSYLRKNLSQRQHLGFATVAVLLSYPVALTPFYVWMPYFLAAFWLVVFTGIQKSQRSWSLLAGFSALTVLMALLVAVSKFGVVNIKETLPRSGFFSEQWQALFHNDKGLIFALVLLGFLTYRQTRLIWFSVLLALSFYALMNLNLLTGREYQNFHFKDYLPVLWWVSVIAMLAVQYQSKRKFLTGFLSLLIAIGLVQHLRSQLLRPSFAEAEYKKADLLQIIQYANERPENSKVYCGEFYQILPLETKVRCSWHHLLMTYPLSNKELLDHSLANFKLLKAERHEIEKTISMDARPSRPLSVWSFGVRPEWVNGDSEVFMYSVENLKTKIVPLWMKEFDQISETESARLINADYYILKNPVDPNIWKAEALFSQYGVYTRKDSN